MYLVIIYSFTIIFFMDEVGLNSDSVTGKQDNQLHKNKCFDGFSKVFEL